MFKRTLLMSLLALSLVAFFTTEATALLRGGTGGSGSSCDCDPSTTTPACTFCAKCVDGYVRLVSLGNVNDTPTYVLLSVYAQAEENILPLWVVICGNPGNDNWPAPGINIAYFETSFSGIESIDPADIEKNGSTYATVPAEPTPAMLQALANVACPNPNWIAWDAIPCSNMHGVFEEIIEPEPNVCYLRSKLTYNNCYIEGCPGSVNWTWDDISQKYTFVPTPYTCPEEPFLDNFSKNLIPIVCPWLLP